MIKPPYLKPGDRVGIIPPSSYIDSKYIEKSVEIFEDWGLEVEFSKNLYNRYFQFAGTDSERSSSLQSMLNDPDLKAILCARGGYGITRFIDGLSFEAFRKFPKWVVGFSDITPLLMKILSLGIECIHGPMPLTIDPEKVPISLTCLKNLLFGEKSIQYEFPPDPLNIPGHAEGKVTGGNLSLLTHCIGSATDFNNNGEIFFLEETDEYLYRLDRMMVQMKRAARLSGLEGLIVGHLTGMKENERPFGKTAKEIIREHTQDSGFPVCFGIPIGHAYPNYPIPVGRAAHLEVAEAIVRLEFLS